MATRDLGRLKGRVATMGHSTGYPDVDAVLAELLAGVRGTLGPQLVGVYLDGSLAAGDFAEHSSDIDLLVVTEDALSDEVVAALGTMHARLATGTSKWARELEVSYIPRRALRRFDPENNVHPCIQRGSDQLLIEEHDRAWVIHRHVVREHGIVLMGPHPRALIDPVDAGDLRAAVVSLLHGWWTPTPTGRRWLNNPFYRSYAVLTMCRMRYTLQYGVVVSKPIAARWAQASLDARRRSPGRMTSFRISARPFDSLMTPGRRASGDRGKGHCYDPEAAQPQATVH